MSLVHPNPTEMQEIVTNTFKHLLDDDLQMTRVTTTSLLFKLREVSTSWCEVADHLKKQIKSLSLLPLPPKHDSRYYFSDLLQAKLFRMRRSSYLGPTYSRFFTRSGSIKKQDALLDFIRFYPNIYYLSVVELNSFILSQINTRWPNLKALAFESVNVSEEQLASSPFRSSLRIVSFGAKVTEESRHIILTLFPVIEIVHFTSTSRAYAGMKRINLNFLNHLNGNVKRIYFGNRLVSSRPARNTNCSLLMESSSEARKKQRFASSIEALELLQCDFEQIHPLINRILPQFTELKQLSLDVSNISHVSVLKTLGQLKQLTYLALNLPHGCQVKGDQIPLKDILCSNSNLNTLILTGHYEYPALEDVQLNELCNCQNLTYICIYAIMPTSTFDRVDYISIFSKLKHLQVLHIDYVPLSEPFNSQLRKDFYTKIGSKLKSFSLICWCCMRRDYGCCDSQRKEPYVIHDRMCYCMFNPPETFLPLL